MTTIAQTFQELAHDYTEKAHEARKRKAELDFSNELETMQKLWSGTLYDNLKNAASTGKYAYFWFTHPGVSFRAARTFLEPLGFVVEPDGNIIIISWAK